MAKQRIEILGVPVDIIQPQDMEKEILELLAHPAAKQIMFLSIWDLLKAKVNKEFLACIKNADLVLPISKSILRGAKFLKLPVPVRYNPFNAVINILTILENHYKSLYILGGRKQTIMAAERNVRSTYKNLQIVGRYVGYYPKTVENDVVEAIYKAAPSLVLVSEGIRERNMWSYNRRTRFSSSIFLFYRDAVGVFSERRSRVSDRTFDKGLEIFSEIIRNPLKIFLIFPFIYYIIALVWQKTFSKD